MILKMEAYIKGWWKLVAMLRYLFIGNHVILNLVEWLVLYVHHFKGCLTLN